MLSFLVRSKTELKFRGFWVAGPWNVRYLLVGPPAGPLVGRAQGGASASPRRRRGGRARRDGPIVLVRRSRDHVVGGFDGFNRT